MNYFLFFSYNKEINSKFLKKKRTTSSNISPEVLKKRFYLFLERRKGDREEEKHPYVRLPLTCPQPGTRPASQACALTWNRTCDLLVYGKMPNPPSHTGQGCSTVVPRYSSLIHSRTCDECRNWRVLIYSQAVMRLNTSTSVLVREKGTELRASGQVLKHFFLLSKCNKYSVWTTLCLYFFIALFLKLSLIYCLNQASSITPGSLSLYSQPFWTYHDYGIYRSIIFTFYNYYWTWFFWKKIASFSFL